ncbi:hypothetical protein GEMRC1_009345 [Eukaryota sp. GEM-RC1]
MFIGHLPGKVIDTSSTTRVRDHVIYTPNQFCYRRPGAFIAFFQAIDYILGSNSWLPPFQLYLLENYFVDDRALSNSDLIQAYGHLKKEGINVEVNEDWFNVDVAPRHFPSLLTLPLANPVVSWNIPPVFEGISRSSLEFEIPRDRAPDPALTMKQCLSNVKAISDPYHYSQIVLSMLRSFRGVYEVAATQFPLISSYWIEFPHLESLKYLQFVEKKDSEEFWSLFEFLTNLTITEGKVTSLFDATSPNSFQVVTAKATQALVDRLEQILLQEDQARGRHRASVELFKSVQQSDEKEFRNMNCSCFYTEATWRNNYKSYKVKCDKCKLGSTIRNRRHSKFENLLPTCSTLRFSLMFDFNIPTQISNLYDAVFNLRSAHEIQIGGSSTRKWSCPRTSTSNSSNIYLASSAIATGGTRLRDEHIDCPMDLFFVKCGKTVELHSSGVEFSKGFGEARLPSKIRTSLEFPYKSLTFALGFGHTQNRVLSSFSDCPHELSLKKFEAFGSLRTGLRISLGNLLSLFITAELEFSSPSTIRCIQIKFLNFEGLFYVEKICKAIQSFANTYRDKWDHYRNLESCLIVLDKLSELHDSPVINQTYDVIREILHDWKSCCSSDFLFSISVLHIRAHKRWYKEPIVTTSLLHSIYHYSLENVSVKETAAVYRAMKALSSFEFSKEVLDEFVFEAAKFDCSGVGWNRSDSWYYTDIMIDDVNYRVEFNRRSGEFLINRKTATHLPLSIRNWSVFEILFGSDYNPSIIATPYGYRTVESLNGFIYEFHVQKSIQAAPSPSRYSRSNTPTKTTTNVKVFQKCPTTNRKWCYICSNKLNHLPSLLSSMYHWLSRENLLEIRRTVLDPDSTEFIWTSEGVVRTVENDIVLPTSCPLLQCLVQFFFIESSNQIIITCGNDLEVKLINLYRYNLDFVIDQNQLVCRTLNMVVEATSPCNDLYIPQSLFLSTATTFQMLVPFGEVQNRTITIPTSQSLPYYRYSWSNDLNMFTSNSDQLAWLYLTLLYGMFNISLKGFQVAFYLLISHSFPTQSFQVKPWVYSKILRVCLLQGLIILLKNKLWNKFNGQQV